MVRFRVKQLSNKLIEQLQKNGFKKSGEAYDRGLVFGQDFRKDFEIDGREYTIIFGIFQAYMDGYKVFDHALNGQLVLDVFPNDGEESEHEGFLIDTFEALIRLTTLSNLWE